MSLFDEFPGTFHQFALAPENSYLYINLMHLKVLSLLIILVIFRFQFLASIQQHELSRLFIILPIAYTAYLVFDHVRKFRGLKAGLEILFLTQAIIVGLAYVFLEFGLSSKGFMELVSEVASTHLFLVFPLLFMLYIRNSATPGDDILYVLDRVCVASVVLGTAALWVEYTGYQSQWWDQYTYMEWLIPQRLSEAIGSGYKILLQSHSRAYGPLANPNASAFLITASALYLFDRFQGSIWKYFFLLLAIISVFLTSAFLAMIGYFVIFCAFFVNFRTLFESRRQLAGLTALAVLIAVLIHNSPAEERFLEYWRNAGSYWAHFQPTLTDCSSLSFWGPSITTEFCAIREVKILAKVFTLGLIPLIPWLAVVFLPLAWIHTYRQKPGGKAVTALLLMHLFSTLHYPSMETWGNNYIYALAAIFIVWPASSMRQSSQPKSVEQR
jgi:hypothetical protein